MKKIIFVLLLSMTIIETTNASFVSHMHKDSIYCNLCHKMHSHEELLKSGIQFRYEYAYQDNIVVTNVKEDKPYLKLIGGVVLWAVCTSLTSIFVCRLIEKGV